MVCSAVLRPEDAKPSSTLPLLPASMFAVVSPVMLPEKPPTPALVLRMLAVAMPVSVTPAASAGLPSREATCGQFSTAVPSGGTKGCRGVASVECVARPNDV